MQPIPSRVIAACFGLMGFAAASVVGISAGNPASTILGWALLTMLAGWVVGLAIGSIAQRTVDDHLSKFKQQHPIPGSTEPPSGGAAAESEAA